MYVFNEYTTNWTNSGVSCALVMFQLFMHGMSARVPGWMPSEWSQCWSEF